MYVCMYVCMYVYVCIAYITLFVQMKFYFKESL